MASRMIDIEPPMRVINVIVSGCEGQVRPSIQNVTVTHKHPPMDLGWAMSRWWYYGVTDTGMGVLGESWSGDVTDFSQLTWEILAGERLTKDIVRF